MSRIISILFVLVLFVANSLAQTGSTQTTKTQTTKPTTTKPQTTKPQTTKPSTTKPQTTKSQPTKSSTTPSTTKPATTKTTTGDAQKTSQPSKQITGGNNQLNEVQITKSQPKKTQSTGSTGTQTSKTQPVKTAVPENQTTKVQQEVKTASQDAGDIPDTIILVSGKKVLAKIQSVSSSKITYYPHGKSKIEEMARKQVHKILYKTGRVEFFNKPAFEMVNEGDFKTIVLTEKEEEVEGLFPLGKVDAQSSKNSRNAKAAERSADIRLQKKAANMGAIMVLITKRESKGGYGEVPTHFVEGIAYGLEPAKEQPK